jgi:hypothetical protein
MKTSDMIVVTENSFKLTQQIGLLIWFFEVENYKRH